MTLSGDLRLLISGLERNDRAGAKSYLDEGILRVRAGGAWRWSDRASLIGRFATSVSTDGNRWRLGWFDSAPSSGLAHGDATLDLAYLLLKPAQRLSLRLGRFQESLALPAVPDKSLDRKDSDSVSIGYTDGMSLEWDAGHGWRLLAIAQYNPADGATNAPRAPLTFRDSGSRVSGFLALRKTDDAGFWALRSLNLTVLPQTLSASGGVSTYTAAVANGAVRWPASSAGRHFLVGGSLGYAPRVPASADRYGAARMAWQATANLMNFASLRQSIGVVWMRSGAGWLLSPDLASNTQLWEVRYRIVPLGPLTLEARLRYRSDDEWLPAARQAQRDKDGYLRATWRF